MMMKFLNTLFPSLIGSLKTEILKPVYVSVTMFPSLIGSLKTKPEKLEGYELLQFPSLIGSLKTKTKNKADKQNI